MFVDAAITSVSRGAAASLKAGTSLTSLVLLALSGTAPANAQSGQAAEQTAPSSTTGGAGDVTTSTPTDNPTATDDGGDGGQIVVTGIRQSLQAARDRKRLAEQVIDSISAQDIGALPDRSVAEALQRVPGVTLQRTNEARDPARLSSEGGGIFIRGLSFVRSEINGRDSFSANNGRGLSFDDISSDLLAGVDVYKNPSAELVEGGIGGIVNLRTRKPFDATGRVVAFSGDVNYADLRKKTFVSGNVLVSDRWNTGIGEIGLLLSYSINNIGNRTDSISAGRYDRATLATGQDGLSAGTNVFIPAGMGFRRIDWKQRRTAFDGSIQWKPTDTLQLTGEALISQAKPQDIEFAVGDYDTPAPNNATYQFGDDRNLEAGTITNRNLNFNTRSGKQRRKTQDYSLNARWTPDDHWAVGADFQYVKSAAEVYSMTAFTGAYIPATIQFDLSGNDPRMVMTPTNTGQNFNAKDRYWWAAAMDHIEDNDANEYAGRADVEYTFSEGSLLRSFRLGGRYTDRSAITRQTGYNWSLLSEQYWGATGNPVYLNQTGAAGGPQNAELPTRSQYQTYNNFFRGKVAMPTPGFWFPSANLVSNGTDYAFNFLRATKTGTFGWTPLSDDYSLAAPAGDNVSGGINNQGEKTYAGYALLRFGQEESFAGHFDGNIGIRAIRTETSAVGSATRLGALTAPTCTVGTPILSGPRAGQTVTAADCAVVAQATAFTQGNIGGQLTQSSGNYTDVLPSLNLRFFLQDNLQLRFAAAKAIVRPTFAQLNAFTTLSFSFDSATGIANGVGANGRTTAFTGISGNPNLKPTRANQFDASLEYYFGRSNSITLAGFYKRISDYIFAGVSQRQFTSNGQTVTFDLTEQTNGSKGTIKGFELGYTQFFDFLPGALNGLGFNGNFTYVDSSGGRNTAVNVFDTNQTTQAGKVLPLEGLSKYSFNAAAVYEKYGISARVAYNWRSTYLLTTSAANINFPVWFEKFGQLDASILYNITKNVKIGLQGTNLLNSRSFLQVGDPDLKPRYLWSDTDRRFAFLVRGVF